MTDYIALIGENFNVSSTCYFNYDSIYFQIETEYINNTYILCNFASNDKLKPLIDKKNYKILVSNNGGL